MSFWGGQSIFQNTENIRYEKIAIFKKITDNFTQKIKVRGSVEKMLFQDDFRKTFLVKIHSLENADATFVFSKEDFAGIFAKIPKNLTLEIGDFIEFSGKLQATISPKKS